MYKSLLYQVLPWSSIVRMDECMHVVTREAMWMTPYFHYLKIGGILDGEDKGWVRRLACKTVVGKLFS